MPIDGKTYQELKALTGAPNSKLTDETRTAALQAIQEFEDQNLNASLQLDNRFSLLPQALSVQPGTTHPAGDEAAADEWQRGEGKEGTVIVYDVPLEKVKEDLLDRPGKLQALYPDLPPGYVSTEQIINLKPTDEVYKDYQEMTWRQTAEAAAQGGKRAYRYSKAPWLQGEGMNETIAQFGDQVKASLQPASEGITSFVMGVDNMATLGAGRKAAEMVNPEMSTPNELLGIESVGGIPKANAEDRFRMLEEENPTAYLGGQALAALRGWGVAGALYNQAMGLAGRVGGNLAARAAANTAAGVAGSVATQVGQDAVQMGGDALQGKEDGLALPEVGSRALQTATVSTPLAALGGGVAALASGRANNIRWGNRYDGKVGRLEEDVPDMKFRPLRGPTSPSIEELKVQARKAGKEPGDMLASEVAPKIAGQLDQDTRGVLQQVEQRRNDYLKSPEAKQKLPATKFTEAVVKELRADMEAVKDGGVPKPVGTSKAGGDLKEFFNSEVEGVSLAPAPGAVELTPEEAAAFLGPHHQRGLRRSMVERPSVTRKPGRSPDGPAALSPQATVPPGGGAKVDQLAGNKLAMPVEAPEAVPNVPATRTPNATDAATRRFGAKAALPGGAGAPKAEPPKQVRVSGPGRKETEAKQQRELLRSANKDLSGTLRAQGYDRVYVVPRRHDAEHHETLLDKINAWGRKNDRDMAKLDHAARVDRDARPLDGKPGGWSQLQNEHSAIIDRAKTAQELGAPGGDAFKVLTSYGKQKAGEEPTVDVLRDAADRVGVREQLNKIRSLAPYDALLRESNLRPPSDPSKLKQGRVQGTLDMLSVRAFPFWRAMEGGGGVPGRAAQGANIGRDEDEQQKRKKQLRERTRQ